MLPGTSLAEKKKIKKPMDRITAVGGFIQVSSHFNSDFVQSSQIVDIRITIMNLNLTEL